MRLHAVLPPQTAIGDEATYAAASALKLKNDNVNVGTVTHDQDSAQLNGMRRVFPNIVSLKDSRHFSQSQRKAINKAKFSDTMFQGKTKRLRTKKQLWFAEDLRRRCTAEFKNANRHIIELREPLERKKKLKALLKKVPDAIINCFSGDCSSCHKYSLVCKAGEPWHDKRILKSKLTMTRSDKIKCRSLILKRLGPAAIDVTYLDSNTQKVEAINRAYNKANPKNVTCLRNFRGRLGSVVLERNLGFRDSTLRQQKAVQHTISENIRHKIEIKQREKVYLLKYHKMNASKKFRALKRLGMYKLYSLNPKSAHDNANTYKPDSAELGD